jgi:two-component system cell cycle response regulator
MNVLTVDDDPVSSLIFRRALESLGHTVTAVRNGGEALDVLAESRVTMIISDWKMPEMDGLELCRRVRAGQSDFYTYFVLLASNYTYEDSVAAFDAGVDDFVVKSLDTVQLFARLNVAQRILAMQEQLLCHASELLDRQAELAIANATLCEQVSTDRMTSLKNHHAFYEELDRAYSLATRHNLAMSLILLDIDHFKSYNDTYGHLAGDQVLRDVAAILTTNARDHDFVARYGGEEFAIIVPMATASQALAIGERLRSCIEAGPWPQRPITASFGIASWTASVVTAADIVDRADIALYCSKGAGRNRCTLYSEGLTRLSCAA